MFDRISRRQAQSDREEAYAEVVKKQADVVERFNTEAYDEKVAEARYENRVMLENLREANDLLNVPSLVVELNSLPDIGKYKLQADRIDWKASHLHTVDSNGNVNDGVKALAGWVITPTEGKQSSNKERLSSFVGVYQERREDIVTAPRLVTAPLFVARENGKSQRLDILLKKDSEPTHRFLELQAMRANLVPESPDSERDTYQKKVWSLGSSWSDNTYIGLAHLWWELGSNRRDRKGRDELSLDENVTEAHELMDAMHEHAFGNVSFAHMCEQDTFISPDEVDVERRVYQSGASLGEIETLFAPAKTIKKPRNYWFSKEVTITTSAGPLAKCASVLTPSPHVARQDLARRLDYFYNEALGNIGK